ncbi:MAG TPA: dATP pyrophosphohydrolase [Stellaceae bacterium]|nr:dATP pyrophosphohydrolase [Stellaceae bacterium]
MSAREFSPVPAIAAPRRGSATALDVRISEARDRRDLRRFLDVPYAVYRNDPNWIAPLRREILKILDRRRNPFFDHGEACYWIAWRGDRPVGRISAQINRLHLETHRDATGNFGFFEAIDDPGTISALLDTAEAWLKARGMSRVVGPYSLSINDEIGIPVAGTDLPPVFGMAYAPRYYATALEARGYRKAKDFYALRFDMYGDNIREVERLERVSRRLRAACRVRPIDMHRFADDMKRAVEVYNDAWSGNWGFVPVTEREVMHFVKDLRQIIVPEFVQLAEVNGRVEGFLIAIPNLNEAIADLGGRLFPVGWAKLLWRLRMRPFTTARVVLAGVSKSLQNSPLSATLLSAMLAEIIKAGRAEGLDWVELSWVLEDNARSMALCQRAGGRLYKTYRVYGKTLD